MPFGNSRDESQRDSGAKPRVARHELPWVTGSGVINPKGVAAGGARQAATPLGLCAVGEISKVRAPFVPATLGGTSIWQNLRRARRFSRRHRSAPACLRRAFGR